MVIFFRKWMLFFGVMILLIPTDKIMAESTAEPTNLYSRACALIDGDSGRVLYGKEEENAMANASTTKILTCIVALENGNMEDVVTASKKAAAQPKVHLGMHEGEEFYLKDLLYSLMLESYNDAAVAIAEHIAGTTEEFAVLMNEKAKELGCKDTYFITPNGLDASDENGFHHTTASDLCQIMKYCTWDSVKSVEFCEITQKRNHTFQSLSGRSFSLNNRNAFFSMMDGVISGKTGFTADAGYCYVAALESNGKKYCIALLACGWPNNRTYKWDDAKELFAYGIKNYFYKASNETITIPHINVTNGHKKNETIEDWGKTVTLQPVADYMWQLEKEYLLKESEQITYELDIQKEYNASIESVTQVGTISFFLEEECLSIVPIYAGETVEKWTFRDLFQLIVKEYIRF